MAVKLAFEIIVLSPALQEYFRSTSGLETRFIPNGVNTPSMIPAQKIMKDFSLSQDSYTLFLRGIAPEKMMISDRGLSGRQYREKPVIASGYNSNASLYTLPSSSLLLLRIARLWRAACRENYPLRDTLYTNF